jgi:hypothetical protein
MDTAQKDDSHGDTGPRNELSSGDEIDPPIQNLDRSLRDRQVGETADNKSERDRNPRDTPLIGSSQDFGCLSSLCHAKEGPRSGKDERVCGREDA